MGRQRRSPGATFEASAKEGDTMTDPEKERLKQEFRDALERKKHRDIHGTAHLDAQSKARGPKAHADHHREFRRKSV